VSVTDIFPLPKDILSGDAGSGLGSTVPTGTQYDPYDTALLAIRPKDYGSINPTDLADTAINVPTDGLKELVGKQVEIENFKTKIPDIKKEREADVEMKGQGVPKSPPIVPRWKQMEDQYDGQVGKISTWGKTTETTTIVDVDGVPTPIVSYKSYWLIVMDDGSFITAYDLKNDKPANESERFLPQGTPVVVRFKLATSEYSFDTL
jgi:hypothetical protein